MSNLLEQASLVMIPSGYKEDVVYSEIPIDGAGDLSFTRASNGTRVNSAGLVEVVPWNLLEQSETFDSGTWSKTGVTVTANTTTAPNGTTTADTLVFGASSNEIVQSVGNLSVNETYTLTIYLRVASGTATMYWGNIDYTTPTITVTTEWQRFTVTQQAAATTRYPKLVSSSAMTVFAWGAQLNIGSTAKPYFPTTDRLNVPRLTYQNGGGGCPSLLLEKQSTNLQIYSEQFDLWSTTSDLSVTANNTTSPDGTQNADKLNENSSNGYHIIGDSNITLSASTIYTTSFFAKASERSYARMLAPASNYASESAYFDLTNGNCSATAGTVSTQSMGNGWYRCIWSLTTLPSVSGGIGMWFGPARNMTDAYNTYTGTSGSGIFAWGAQIEQSSYATSLINTTSSSATRVADACFKTGISSLIGGTSGTVFFDIKTNPVLTSENYKQFFYYTDSSANQGYMYLNSGNGIITNPSFGNLSSSITLSPNTRYKVALTYANNDFALYVNGVSVATASSGTPLNFENLLSLGSYQGTSEFNQFVFNQYTHFKSRLTNAELASLTTI